MNKQDFNQLGGFPLETDTLDWMQNAYDIFNTLGYIAGDKTILTGCTQTGSVTSDGVVFVNGELFPFKGGTTQATVRILETKTPKVFENGDVNDVHSERYITFATGTGSIPWSDFKTFDSLKNITSRILPVGTNPQAYVGPMDAIPEGWELYLPMKGQFVVGYDPDIADYNAIGKTGGSKEITLTESQMPAHTHTASVNVTDPGHAHGLRGAQGGSGYPTLNDGLGTSGTTKTATTGISVSVTNASKGGGIAHENRPNYYVMAWIIYTGL